jgi:hypothetical protein
MRRAVFLSDLQYFISEIDNISILVRERKRKLSNFSDSSSHNQEHGHVANIFAPNEKQQVSPLSTDFQLSVQNDTVKTIIAAPAATAKSTSISSKDACIVWEESNISSLAGIGNSATLDHDHSVNKNQGLTFEDASVCEAIVKSDKNIALDSNNKLSMEDIGQIMESAPLFHSIIAVRTPLFKLLCPDAESLDDKETFKTCYNHIQAELLART